MSENEKTREVSQVDLEAVSGGEGLTGMCLFTPSGERKEDDDHNYTWLKCNSRCTIMCCCHGEDHCVNNWHKIYAIGGGLVTKEFANHRFKYVYNDYNTK